MSPVLNVKPNEIEWTADEFYHSPLSQNHELIEGELVETMSTGFIHGVVAQRIGRFIGNFADENNLGEVAAAETGFILGEKTCRGADSAFISNENLEKHGYPQGFFPTAPDIAVEVVSPNNTSEEMMEKVNLYLQNGSQLVWVIYPQTKVITVYRQSNIVSLLRENDTLEGEDVLPNFKLEVSKLFANLPKE
jgi:Uma2 family endonuclease